MADRKLREADLAAEPGDGLLVLGIFPGMHEDDGHGFDAVALRLLDQRLDGRDVEQFLDRAVGADALVDLDDAFVELLGKDDLLGEDVGPRLVGDAQRVAKPFGDEQQHAVALALQQRVGGDGGAHLDLADKAGGDRRAGGEAEQVANALDRRVAIGFRIFRQELSRMQRAFGVAADDVGEGAAAIDPEIPFFREHRISPGNIVDFRLKRV